MAITEDGTEVRLRQSGEQYFRTVKSGGNEIRDEFEIEITRDQFEGFWPATAGKRLTKTRYRIPPDVELDIYHGNLQGLQIVEVEFESVEAKNKFAPLSWFGKEVTDDERYKNKNLATKGMPKDI